MTPTGLHQWLPRWRWLPVGLIVAQAALLLEGRRPVEGPLDLLVSTVLVLAAAYVVITALGPRVRADDQGLHVRGTGWRTVDVPWVDVEEIWARPVRWSWGQAELVVLTRTGSEVRTRLWAADHEASLVEHWHARTGRESVPAA